MLYVFVCVYSDNYKHYEMYILFFNIVTHYDYLCEASVINVSQRMSLHNVDQRLHRPPIKSKNKVLLFDLI